MSITKTIGGNRLGSGKKMKTELHAYERSTHDLSRVWRSTMQVGVLTPCFRQLCQNGDTFEIKINHKVLTAPTNGPTFGVFKMQIDMFMAPIRLYNGLLHNNAVKIGMEMNQVKFPTIVLDTAYLTPAKCEELNIDYDTHQISPSSLLAYCGIRGVGRAQIPNDPDADTNDMVRRQFNAMYILEYYDIFKNYYANKQEETAYVIFPNPRENAQGIIPDILYGGFWVGLLDKTNKIRNINAVAGTNFSRYNQNNEEIDINGDLRRNDYGDIITRPIQIVNSDVFQINDISQAGKIFVDVNIGSNGSNIVNGTFAVPEIADTIIITKEGRLAFDISIQKALAAAHGVKNTTAERAEYSVLIRSIKVNPSYNTQIKGTELHTFELENIDKARRILLSQEKGAAIQISPESGIGAMYPYRANVENYKNYVIQQTGAFKTLFAMHDLCGLCVKTYQSDIFNNWLNSEWIIGSNGISAITNIDVSNGTLNLDTLNIAQKTYNVLNRIAIAGGTFEDWQEAVYGIEAVRRAESPIYLGGQSSHIVFDEVIRTGGEGVLGDLAGKGTEVNKKDGYIYVKADEPSLIMGIASITPLIDYSQGNDWVNELTTLDDIHKPGFDRIGYQNLPTWQMAWWDGILPSATSSTGYIKQFSAGKQPSWIHYQTAYNECFGDMAVKDKMMFMTLNRRYESIGNIEGNNNSTIADLTTYIDPTKYNYIFAMTTLEAQNFWVQIAFDVKARRIMSANQIANL